MTADPPGSRLQFLLPAAVLFGVVLVFVVLHLVRGEDDVSPLERGTLWLVQKQHADGSWRGEEIAVLRPGPAMTAFVLYALTRLPDPLRARFQARLDRAVPYLESQIDGEGIVGMTSQGPDYPNYATSLTVLSFVALNRPVSRMVDSLKRAQLDESEGWATSDPEYGGWAFGGPLQTKPNAHRLDISSTRFALEALAAAKVPADDPVWAKARRFLATCQNDDGGFVFTPLPGQNKAGDKESYGTATADGLLSLRYAGGPPERIEKAKRWIESNPVPDRCPGFALDSPRPWGRGLLGYWWAVAARIASTDRLREVILQRQRPDGSWINDVDIMLENEPLLATTFAVLALSDAGR